MKYLAIAFMLLAAAACGKLIGGGISASEDRRRAQWQGRRKPELDEDPDIQPNMHGRAE